MTEVDQAELLEQINKHLQEQGKALANNLEDALNFLKLENDPGINADLKLLEQEIKGMEGALDALIKHTQPPQKPQS